MRFPILFLSPLAHSQRHVGAVDVLANSILFAFHHSSDFAMAQSIALRKYKRQSMGSRQRLQHFVNFLLQSQVVLRVVLEHIRSLLTVFGRTLEWKAFFANHL